jgi:hypothetical protein
LTHGVNELADLLHAGGLTLVDPNIQTAAKVVVHGSPEKPLDSFLVTPPCPCDVQQDHDFRGLLARERAEGRRGSEAPLLKQRLEILMQTLCVFVHHL